MYIYIHTYGGEKLMVYSLSAAEVLLKNRKDYHQKVGYNFHLSSRLKKSEKKIWKISA